jgi:pSer/pThr/pTyr-binding forkhead associated (FHA) protein
MTPPPETPDAEFDHLVAEALQTQPLKAEAQSPLLERLRTIEEYLSGVVPPAAHPVLIYRDDEGKMQALAIREKVTVGRRHFSVEREDNFFILRDHGSRNGTFINNRGEAIAEHVLRDGDIISAGGRSFVFSGGFQDTTSSA